MSFKLSTEDLTYPPFYAVTSLILITFEAETPLPDSPSGVEFKDSNPNSIPTTRYLFTNSEGNLQR